MIIVLIIELHVVNLSGMRMHSITLGRDSDYKLQPKLSESCDRRLPVSGKYECDAKFKLAYNGKPPKQLFFGAMKNILTFVKSPLIIKNSCTCLVAGSC